MTAISAQIEQNMCFVSDAKDVVLERSQKSGLKRSFEYATDKLKSGLSFVKSKLRNAFQVAKDNPILTMSAFVAVDMLLMGGGHTQSMMLAAGSAVIGALTQSALNGNSYLPGSIYGASCKLPYMSDVPAPQPV